MMTAISALAARWSSRSFASQPSLQFLVRLDFEGVFCLGQCGLAVLNCFFAPGYVEVFLRQPLFKIAAGGFNERRGQRFRQLDLIFAFWTNNGWFGHKHSSSFGVRVHLTQNRPTSRKILNGNGGDLNLNGVAANPRSRRARCEIILVRILPVCFALYGSEKTRM